MWEVWLMSQSMSKRPSEILYLRSSLVAFYVDRAIWRFGSAIDAELSQAENNAKNEKAAMSKRLMILSKWIPESRNSKGMYRDPAAGMSKQNG